MSPAFFLSCLSATLWRLTLLSGRNLTVSSLHLTATPVPERGYMFFPESSQMLPRLTQRIPWFGAAVTRLTCQEKETLSPFGWIYLTARHSGHLIWNTEAASIWRASSSIFPEKAHPGVFRVCVALASPTESRPRPRSPTCLVAGFGAMTGGVATGRLCSGRVPCPSLTDEPFPAAPPGLAAPFPAFPNRSCNCRSLSVFLVFTSNSPARASISRLTRLAG